jgi:hypothetical protein
MASPALPGVFLTFAAMVLLIFVSVSVPVWYPISLLNVGPATDNQLRYGVFGFTGSKAALGYDFSEPSLNTTTLHNLTVALILHPIAAGLTFLAFLFGLCGLGYHRTGTVFMTLVSLLALLITFIVWVIDMVLFGIARNKYLETTTAQYGNGVWLTLGAFVALLLGFCASACGVFGRYRNRTATR